MKVYHKIISKTNAPISNIKTSTMYLIKISSIEYLSKYIAGLYKNKVSLKFVFDKAMKCIHMISFDKSFNTTYRELKCMLDNEFKGVVINLDGAINVIELDLIIKYAANNYYIYIEDDNRYMIECIPYKINRNYAGRGTVCVSDWYVRNEKDNNSVHVLSINANYKCDEDEGIYYKKAGEKFIDIVNRIIEYEEHIGSNFYTKYCSMNTFEYVDY